MDVQAETLAESLSKQPPKGASSALIDKLSTLSHDALLDFLADKIIPKLETLDSKEFQQLQSETDKRVKSFKTEPSLDVKQMKYELTTLFVEIIGQNPIGGIGELAEEDSNEERSKHFQEILDSIHHWIQKIWTVCFDRGFQFQEGHEMLLYLVSLLEMLKATKNNLCNCEFSFASFTFEIKDDDGDVVKDWEFTSGNEIIQAIEWVWREMFVQMIAIGVEKDQVAMKKMWREMEEVKISLITVFRGGRPLSIDNTWNSDYDLLEKDIEWQDDGDLEGDYGDLELLNEPHWDETAEKALLKLEDLVTDHHCAQFKKDPTPNAFKYIASLDCEKVYREVMWQWLRDNAAYGRNIALCALRVFLAYGMLPDVVVILDSCKHLFQHRDTILLQAAARHLLESDQSISFRNIAAKLIETELADTIHNIALALELGLFKEAMDEEERQRELNVIGGLKTKDPNRKEKVKNWIFKYITPPAMDDTVLAMMFGLPPPDEDSDVEPDVEDSEEQRNSKDTSLFVKEHTPNGSMDEVDRNWLSKRWLAWETECGKLARGTPCSFTILCRTEREMLRALPWMRYGDLTAEIVRRLGINKKDRPLLDAMRALIGFYKSQIKQRHKCAQRQQHSRPTTQQPSPTKRNSITNLAKKPVPATDLD